MSRRGGCGSSRESYFRCRRLRWSELPQCCRELRPTFWRVELRKFITISSLPRVATQSVRLNWTLIDCRYSPTLLWVLTYLLVGTHRPSQTICDHSHALCGHSHTLCGHLHTFCGHSHTLLWALTDPLLLPSDPLVCTQRHSVVT